LGLAQHLTVSLFYVFESIALWGQSRASLSDETVKDHLANEEEQAKADLSDFLADLKIGWMPQTVKPATAPVAHMISSFAHETETDLVIVGTHGRTGITK